MLYELYQIRLKKEIGDTPPNTYSVWQRRCRVYHCRGQPAGAAPRQEASRLLHLRFFRGHSGKREVQEGGQPS